MTERSEEDLRFTLGFSASAWPELVMLVLACGAGAYAASIIPSGWTVLTVALCLVGLMRVAATKAVVKAHALEIRCLGGLFRRRSVAYSDIQALRVLRASWSPVLLLILRGQNVVTIGPFDTLSFLGRGDAFRSFCRAIAFRSGVPLENPFQV